MRLSHLAKDVAGLGLYYPGQHLLERMPRGLMAPLARVGGDAVRRLSDLDAARDELTRLLGHADERVIRRAFRQRMYNELEVLRYGALTPQTIHRVCRIQGREHLDAALSKGHGAIVLIGHFGANQMIMPALGHTGYAMNQLSAPPPVWPQVQPQRVTPLWPAVLERRWQLEQRLPVRHISVFEFIRPALRCLQDNQVLGLAFDGGGGKRWTQVALCQRTANVSVMPERLARKTGAALLPTVVFRDDGDPVHTLRIHPPVKSLVAFAEVFSDYVRRMPDHYLDFLLLRRRMKDRDTRPFFDD